MPMEAFVILYGLLGSERQKRLFSMKTVQKYHDTPPFTSHCQNHSHMALVTFNWVTMYLQIKVRVFC